MYILRNKLELLFFYFKKLQCKFVHICSSRHFDHVPCNYFPINKTGHLTPNASYLW